MQDRLPLVIDGTDFSLLFNRHQYTVGYTPQMGENGGLMLDGSETVDILKWKAVLTLPANDLEAAQLSQLLAACIRDYVRVTYFDTLTNAERTETFIPTVGESAFLLSTPQGEKWFTGLTISLREK